MAEPSLFSFYADAPEGSPQSYDALQMRRKIATELAAQKRPYASNIGEGIASMGDSFANAMNMIALDRQSKAFAAREADLIRGLGGLPGDSGPAPAPAPSSSSAPPPPSAAPSPPATPAALPPIAPAPITPQGNAPMSQSAIDAGATQDEVNAARMKVASALTNQGLLSRDTIGGQQPQPLMAPPGNERLVARPPADAGTPPVVTDIPKAPAPPTQAGYSNPLDEQIAPMPKPLEVGPAPVRPPQVPLAPEQRQILDALHSPYLSDNTRKALADRYKVWEDHRQEQQRQSDVDFTFAREDQNKKENQARLEPGKVQAERIGAAQAQVSAKKTELETRQLENAFDTIKGPGEETLIRPKGSPPGTPFMRAPGSPPPQLSAQQQDAVNFAAAVRPDLADVDDKLNYGKALTDPTQVSQAALPFGLGRARTSQEYHSTEDKLGNFAAGFLKIRSGQAVSPSEAMRTLPSIMPRVGDTDADLRDKARRRELIVQAAEGAGGPEARRVADEIVGEFMRNRSASTPPPPSAAPVRVNTPEEAARLPSGTVFIDPNGRQRKVP